MVLDWCYCWLPGLPWAIWSILAAHVCLLVCDDHVKCKFRVYNHKHSDRHLLCPLLLFELYSRDLVATVLFSSICQNFWCCQENMRYKYDGVWVGRSCIFPVSCLFILPLVWLQGCAFTDLYSTYGLLAGHLKSDQFRTTSDTLIPFAFLSLFLRSTSGSGCCMTSLILWFIPELGHCVSVVQMEISTTVRLVFLFAGIIDEC